MADLYYLAQANYAQWKDEVSPTDIQRFLNYANSIMQSATNQDGFVSINPAAFFNDEQVIQAFNNQKLILNISVWKSFDTLRSFVYSNHFHSKAMKDRDLWFDKISKQVIVLWWVKPDHKPTIAEAKKKFEVIEANGPSPLAFNFSHYFHWSEEVDLQNKAC